MHNDNLQIGREGGLLVEHMHVVDQSQREIRQMLIRIGGEFAPKMFEELRVEKKPNFERNWIELREDEQRVEFCLGRNCVVNVEYVA